MIHANIEYHIALGLTLDSKPLFEQSMELVDRYGKQPDWLINDLRFLAFEQIQAGNLGDAIESLKHYEAYCQRRFGVGHPTTLQAKVLMGNWLKAQGATAAATSAFDAVAKEIEAIDPTSKLEEKSRNLLRALVSNKPNDLAAVAGEAAKQGSWLRAASLYGQCLTWPKSDTESSFDADEFRKKALESLEKASRDGQITNTRELAFLKIAPEFAGLRASSEFKDLIVRFEARLRADHLTKIAWSYAMAGDHGIAKKMLNELMGLQLEKEHESLVCYDSACVYSICFGCVDRTSSSQTESVHTSIADEYLKLAIEKLEEAVTRGYLAGAKGTEQLMRDSDFDPIRSTDAFQKIPALINSKLEGDAK
jgi:hypothetical protein